MHRRMRQLSLTETETFVNLAKHALETLNASEDEDTSGRDRQTPGHYSDETNTADDKQDDSVDNSTTAGSIPTISLKTIQSEPVFKKKRQKRLANVLGMSQTEEADEEVEMETKWVGSTYAADEDMLQFVARSTSDIEIDNVDHRDADDDAEPSGDETTHLATAKNLFLC